jgi:hypothetical protein
VNISTAMRGIGGALAVAIAVCATPAYAQPLPSPLSRGEIIFSLHANGLQYPRYAPARAQPCTPPAQPETLRQRLVDLAVQEWARFGYPYAERAERYRARFPAIRALGVKSYPYDEDDPLLLQAVGGYWAALTTVDSSGVAGVGRYEIDIRNETWRQNAAELRSMDGWTTPWSAAFISWLMCEAGAEPFRRSWAHRDYVDAAIAAADGRAPHLYHARGPEHAPQIGDLLCASRAGYRTDLEARRAENGGLGEMHCDLVVAIDAPAGVVLTIGGNVENGVSLAPYLMTQERRRPRMRSVCRETKLCPLEDERLFAVLVLQAPQSDAGLLHAPNLRQPPARPPPRFR